jgi:gamma-glutamyltranspeptidase/glutathione hydrolase
MMVYLAAEKRVHCVDFGLVSAERLDPDDYPLSGVEAAGDLFGWPGVVENRNLVGYPSIAVPGYVDGISQALERYGSMRWADLLAPAIRSAEAGMTVDWYASLKILSGAVSLNKFDESRRVYLANGFPPIGEWAGALPQIRLGRLAETLRRLAEAGPRDFYEGEIAKALVADLQAGGSRISAADLAGFRARHHEVAPVAYREAKVWPAPGLSAGPTLKRALELAGASLKPAGGAPDAAAYKAYAAALQEAYRERLATLGDADEGRSPSCTTHLSVVDRDGNMVALTQTLLSIFGSKAMLPKTGVMMNNGVMWFDPRPGRPNSIGAAKRPLSNMCPTLAERGDGLRVALGASGGRRIMPAVFQLLSFLCDYGMDLDTAFHTPRLDSSGGDLVSIDRQAGTEVLAAMETAFVNTAEVHHSVYPALFACPNAVTLAPGGAQAGAAFVMSPWAEVAAA